MLYKREIQQKMSEENKKEQNLEEEINKAQNESENSNEAETSSESECLELTASEANCNDSAEKSELCTSLLGLTEDYINPIPEEYFIERDNLTRSQWFLFYYETPKRTVTVNVFLGC